MANPDHKAGEDAKQASKNGMPLSPSGKRPKGKHHGRHGRKSSRKS